MLMEYFVFDANGILLWVCCGRVGGWTKQKQANPNKPLLLKNEIIKPKPLGPVLLQTGAGGLREEEGQSRRGDSREEWLRGRKLSEYGSEMSDLTLKWELLCQCGGENLSYLSIWIIAHTCSNSNTRNISSR